MTMLMVVLLMLQVAGTSLAIYSAILAEAGTLKDAVIVIESVPLEIPLISGPANPSWRAEFQDWPPELRAVLEKSDRATAVAPFAHEEVPSGARLVPRSEIEAVFRSLDLLSGWSRFEQVTGARTWQAFSRPVLSADGLQALVYTEHHCGGLCGHGKYVWLSRRKENDVWRITRQVVRWMS